MVGNNFDLTTPTPLKSIDPVRPDAIPNSAGTIQSLVTAYVANPNAAQFADSTNTPIMDPSNTGM